MKEIKCPGIRFFPRGKKVRAKAIATALAELYPAEELEARISRASQQLQSMEQQSILRTQQQGESDLKALALAREKLEKARNVCAEAEEADQEIPE